MQRSSLLLIALAVLVWADTACAQPPSLFQTRCSELRGAVAALQGREADERITIEVIGLLVAVRGTEDVAHLGLCGSPDPRVLCVTHKMMGRAIGDRVVVSGTIFARDPDFLQLEPCVHREPGPEDKKEIVGP